MNQNNKISIAHVIDSLVPGGAEQMAVSMVNALADAGFDVHLIVTRHGGLLESKISTKVKVHTLNKKSSSDIGAFKKMLSVVAAGKIQIVHAHSTSIIWATLLKFFKPDLKIIWHDHYGDSEHLDKRPVAALKMLARYWSFVIPVNEKLKDWSIQTLGVKEKNIKFLNNFVVTNAAVKSISEMEESRFKDKIKIVCVANLRPQKDHQNLLDAFDMVANQNESVQLHLIGVNPGNEYSQGLLEKFKINSRIFYWGAQEAIYSWLQYMDIGVLPSKSEGLPVALLEYGANRLKIVATEVGQVGTVLQHGAFGVVIPSANSQKLAEGILDVIQQPAEAKERSNKFLEYIKTNHSEVYFLNEIVSIYNFALNNGSK